MIEIHNLSKSFDKQSVLKNLSLRIEDGTIFGLVGINGAGKSTLLRLMCGIYKADDGVITYDGRNVYDNPNVKKEIFFLSDDPFYVMNTKGKDLLELYKTLYDVDEGVFYKYMDQFNLSANKTINNFSKGMRRQLFIALALSVRPKYLFLDEAFDGLDPLARLSFKKAIKELSQETNCTIIISSHSLKELEDVCDSFGLLDNGYITSSNQISDEIKKVHKLQLVFNETFEKDDFKDLDIVSFTKSGRVIKTIIKGDLEEIKNKITKLNPVLMDVIEVDFEELFTLGIESRGYIK